MKKLILILAIVLGFAGVSWGAGYHATGLTSTDNRSSFTDSYPWACWDGVDLSDYSSSGKWQVTLKDSSGYEATGFSGGAGSGETLGSELVDGWANGSAMFETLTTDGSSITSAINTTGYGICYNITTSTGGNLYLLSETLTLNSGTTPSFWFCSSTNAAAPREEIALSVGVNSVYYIPSVTYTHVVHRVGDGVTTNFAVSLFSLKQITEPAATAIMILDGPSGSAGWAKIDSGFDYNDIVEIEIVPNATLQGASITGVTIN